MNTLQALLQHRIVAIIRGVPPQAVPQIADALYKGGIRVMEITLNSKGAIKTIKEVSALMQQKMLIGAGTVLDAAAAKLAIEAGAEFVIAPSVDIPTIQLTKEMGRVSIPGAFTATEIVLAHKAGADIVKVFPASYPQYIKDLRGPLGHIPMMPTGGVNLQNIRAFHQAGAVAFGIGSALVDAQQMPTPEYLEQLVAKAASFVSALRSND